MPRRGPSRPEGRMAGFFGQAGVRFGMIYAGAQKNIGPAGVTLVVVPTYR